MTNLCFECEIVTTNPKFCSRSCAARYNNTRFPKRKPTYSCIVCQNPTTAQKRICSKSCRDEKYNLHTTIGDLKSRSIRDAQVYNTLRQRSRRIALQSMELECVVCGWSDHVEVCHIKALSELPDTTTVEQATNAHNFVLLCPNHHWNYDHDRLTL